MSAAVIYRMVMPERICPFGLKAKDLLEREGFDVEDHWLESRAETDQFKQAQDVDATPQIFIEGQRVGGYDDLRRHFGRHVPSPDETSYRPVIAIFSVALLIAVAIVAWTGDDLFSVPTVEKFIAISMCLLGVQKLQDVESFSTMFLGYDLLSRRWVRYAYIYPFAETIAGILMLSGALVWVAAPLSIVIGLEGAISIFKAVYIDRKELKCTCSAATANSHWVWSRSPKAHSWPQWVCGCSCRDIRFDKASHERPGVATGSSLVSPEIVATSCESESGETRDHDGREH